MDAIVFETARLAFRRLQNSDFDYLYRMYRDPEVRQYFPDGVRSEQETQEELAYFLNGHPHDPRLGLWATIDKQTGDFVGRCGLLRWEIDGTWEVEIAYMIDPAFWRRGLGSEAANGLVHHAFNELGLKRVIALIDPAHDASIRTAKSAGLSFHKRIEMDGLPTDVYLREAD